MLKKNFYTAPKKHFLISADYQKPLVQLCKGFWSWGRHFVADFWLLFAATYGDPSMWLLATFKNNFMTTLAAFIILINQ
jgi:hypothetical protein